MELATVGGSSTGIGSSVTERLLKGAGAQGFAQAVRVVIRLAEVPLFLAFWGTQLYGEWLIVAAIPVYFALADVGFVGTASREMTIRVGAGDRTGALSIFQSVWLFLLVSSFGVILLAGVAAVTVPFGAWFGVETIGASEFSIVILILAVHVLVNFQTALLYGGFCSEGSYGTGMLLESITQLVEFGGMALAIVLGGGPAEAASGLLAGRVIGLVLMRVVMLRLAPWLHYGWTSASRERVSRLVRPAIASAAFPLGNALNIQGMRLVVGTVLGPIAVAIFSTLLTLSRIGLQLVRSVSYTIEPELGLAFGKGDQEAFRHILRRSCQMVWWGAIVVCLALWFAGERLLGLWTHGQIAMEWFLYGLLLLSALVNAFWYTAMMAAYATNRHGWIAVAYMSVYGFGAAGLAYMGTKILGVPGAGAAIALTEIAMAIYVIPAALRLSEENGTQWLQAVLTPPWFLVRRLLRSRWSG